MRRDKLFIILLVYAGLAVTAYGLSTINTEITIPFAVYAVIIVAAAVGLLLLFTLGETENNG